MAQRVSQDANLTLGQGSPNARVTQDANVTFGQGTPNARVSEVANLTFAGLTTNARASQVACLVFANIVAFAPDEDYWQDRSSAHRQTQFAKMGPNPDAGEIAGRPRSPIVFVVT